MKTIAIAGIASLIPLLASCGGSEPKPVVRLDVEDRRERQSRSLSPAGYVLDPMRDPQGPGRIIYESPQNLALQSGDSLVTAPFGITAAPDSAAQAPGASVQGDSARRPPRAPAQAGPDSARRTR